MNQVYQIVDRNDSRELSRLLSQDGQFLLPMVDLIEQAQVVVEEFIDVVGRAAVEAVLELSAQRVAGPRHQGKAGGEVRRHGNQPGTVCLATQKVRVRKPRLRKKVGGPNAEVPIPAYEAMQDKAPLQHKLGAILLSGVSTRHYERVVPEMAQSCGISKSSVSRGFIAASAEHLCALLREVRAWDPDGDTKLAALEDLLTHRHTREKVLVFTQFADTAEYLARELRRRGLDDLEAVTGRSQEPTILARRFSPRSNNYRLRERESELRALVATDVLSEGQNLQDCHVVVNFDLPWAIIRLVQRAGRVDRIGQEHETIQVYRFLPADGVERIIRLQSRLRLRLEQNNEVVGSDERFFDEEYENKLKDIYTERAGSLDDDEDETDVDLSSEALSHWNAATEADQKAALALPPMVHATRAHEPTERSPTGALVYLRTGEGNDALVRVDSEGRVVSQSLSGILREAACAPDTPSLERHERHHEWVAKAVEAAATDENLSGGRLGPPRSTRRHIYERLTAYLNSVRGTLFATEPLERAINAIYQHPLTSRATGDPRAPDSPERPGRDACGHRDQPPRGRPPGRQGGTA